MTLSTLEHLAVLLDLQDRILLTTHENPDPDAIGALVAMGHYLRSLGKSFRIVVDPEFPAFLEFLDTDGWVEVYAPEGRHRELGAWPGTWLLLDASEPQRLGRLLPAFQASAALKVCLDHHLVDNPAGFDHAFVDPGASATSELVHRLAAPRMEMPWAMARALYAGIADDTGNFRFSSTTPQVHRAVADLLERGVDPTATYQALYHQGRPQKLQVFGRAFAAMRFLEEGRHASTLLTLADLAECDAIKEDLEGLVNKALEVRGVEVSCLLQELPGGNFKASLRSRGRVDVNAVCRELGGGGHRLASGAKVDGPAKAAQNRVDDLVASQIARDIPPS